MLYPLNYGRLSFRINELQRNAGFQDGHLIPDPPEVKECSLPGIHKFGLDFKGLQGQGIRQLAKRSGEPGSVAAGK